MSEGDVRLPKLFRQTVPQRWPGGGKTVVTELVAWSLDQARSIVSRPQRMAVSGGNQQSGQFSYYKNTKMALKVKDHGRISPKSNQFWSILIDVFISIKGTYSSHSMNG